MTPTPRTCTSSEFASAYPGESASVEFKTGAGQQPLQDAIVALSNSGGGRIFVGVTNDGLVTGKRWDQGTDEQINRAALAAHDVGRYDTHSMLVDTVEIVEIVVQARASGFAQTSDGRTLVRRGPRNHALMGADLQDFINRRALQRFEQTSAGLGLDAIDDELLTALGEALGWDPASSHTATFDRLAERGLAQQDSLTIAGALVLTRPAQSLRLGKALVEVIRYPDDGPDYDRREVFGGALQEQVVEASSFVSDELGSDLVVSGLYRYEIPRLPDVVVRETIANAVAHRSYEADRSSIVVELRPNEVKVRSPGPLPEPVTVETMRQAQASRNPSIIAILRAFALAEDAGRGIDVIQDSMREALLDPPTFSDDGVSVTVSLPLRGAITPRERAWIYDLERKGTLSIDDRLLVIHAARGETLTNATARTALGTDDALTARRALQRLRDSGLLVQHGTRGAARYTLVEEVAPPAAYRLSPLELTDLVLAEARTGPVTNESVRRLTGLGRQPVLALLRELVDAGRLEQRGQRRGTHYVLVSGVSPV